MKLNYITFMVRDIEKSIAFYKGLVGLEILNRFNPGMREIAFLSNAADETMLELIQFEGVEKVLTKGMVMSFSVGNGLAELREKAIHLGYPASELINMQPKPTYFTVLDPDGITVEFTL